MSADDKSSPEQFVQQILAHGSGVCGGRLQSGQVALLLHRFLVCPSSWQFLHLIGLGIQCSNYTKQHQLLWVNGTNRKSLSVGTRVLPSSLGLVNLYSPLLFKRGLCIFVQMRAKSTVRFECQSKAYIILSVRTCFKFRKKYRIIDFAD